MNLFQKIDFISAAGKALDFKVECDALKKADWETIAFLASKIVDPFQIVYGVPKGGTPFAKAMVKYETPEGGVLIVDDVWTTGKSLTEFALDNGFIRYQACVFISRAKLLPHYIEAVLEFDDRVCE